MSMPSHFIAVVRALNRCNWVADRLALVVEFRRSTVYSRKTFDEIVDRRTERVLFKTTNSLLWADAGSDFRTDFVYLEPKLRRHLWSEGETGRDRYLSVEKYHSGSYETHTTLLANGVVIVEGLDLRNVTPDTMNLLLTFEDS